jgi:hypothetical protein
LVADVVGYSRLAGADEERTPARLRRIRTDIHSLGHRRRPHRQAQWELMVVGALFRDEVARR